MYIHMMCAHTHIYTYLKATSLFSFEKNEKKSQGGFCWFSASYLHELRVLQKLFKGFGVEKLTRLKCNLSCGNCV